MRNKILVALALFTACGAAHAQLKAPPDRTGLYVVGTLGVSQGNDRDASTARAENTLGSPLDAISVDGRRNIAGALIGYRFNEYFGIEGGYADLGRLSLQARVGSNNFTSRTKIRGPHAALVMFLQASDDTAVYGKFGGVWARTDYESSDGFRNDTNTFRSYWGLGLQVHFTPNLFGRLEYLRFNNLGSTFSGQAAFNHYNLGVGYLFK